ncbi:hypothetical protein LQF12_09150 [Ruania suaedae]|uniref:hypothetical protein n=1 Tax=Ruania suaedae TaxID=2897774 RepID=UPI001E4C0D4D|nr:hypothetical protein [Ruania suaedae]UFU01694.1 hypothetical protein LQF12_09150 [Ruania suaedae]
MCELIASKTTPSRAPARRAARTWAALAGGAVAVAGLAGCSAMESSSAVTYEVEVVSGGSDADNVRVEYTSRETGLSPQETTGATVSAGEATPATFETLGMADDEVSIAVQGVPEAVLSCTVIQDGSDVLEEQESGGPGEPVTCTATVAE